MPPCQKDKSVTMTVNVTHTSRSVNANTGEATSLKNPDGNINNGQENMKP
jgi:hypothetical protein